MRSCGGYNLPFNGKLKLFIYIELLPNQGYWKLDNFSVITNGDFRFECSGITINEGQHEYTESCGWFHRPDEG